MVNDFFLKLMEPNTATLNLKEFTYGLLCGYMERMFDQSGKPIADKSHKMMGYRRERLNLIESER